MCSAQPDKQRLQQFDEWIFGESKGEKFAWRQGHYHVFSNSKTKTGGEEMSVVAMKLVTISVIWAQFTFMLQNNTKTSG